MEEDSDVPGSKMTISPKDITPFFVAPTATVHAAQGKSPSAAMRFSYPRNPFGTAVVFWWWIPFAALRQAASSHRPFPVHSDLIVIGDLPLRVTVGLGNKNPPPTALSATVTVQPSYEDFLKKNCAADEVFEIWSRQLSFEFEFVRPPKDREGKKSLRKIGECTLAHDQRAIPLNNILNVDQVDSASLGWTVDELKQELRVRANELLSRMAEASAQQSSEAAAAGATQSQHRAAQQMLAAVAALGGEGKRHQRQQENHQKNELYAIAKLSFHVHHDERKRLQRHIMLAKSCRAAVGAVGLVNHGTTCFGNALLQVIFHNTAFRREVYRLTASSVDFQVVIDPDADVDPATIIAAKRNSPVLQLQRAFYYLEKSQDPVAVRGLFRSLGVSAEIQQDAHEFLSEQFLHKILKNVSDLFAIRVRFITQCEAVSFRRAGPEETLYDLSVSPRRGNSIEMCIKAELEPEPLGDLYDTGDPELGKLPGATRRMVFVSLPPVLFIHAKRFDAHLKKIHALVKVQHQITVPAEDAHGNRRSESYVLHSVVVHHGSGITSGHYTAYIRAPSPNQDSVSPIFLHFDDEAVYRVREDDVCQRAEGTNWFAPSSSAYIFCFIKSAVFAQFTSHAPTIPRRTLGNLVVAQLINAKSTALRSAAAIASAISGGERERKVPEEEEEMRLRDGRTNIQSMQQQLANASNEVLLSDDEPGIDRIGPMADPDDVVEVPETLSPEIRKCEGGEAPDRPSLRAQRKHTDPLASLRCEDDEEEEISHPISTSRPEEILSSDGPPFTTRKPTLTPTDVAELAAKTGPQNGDMQKLPSSDLDSPTQCQPAHVARISVVTLLDIAAIEAALPGSPTDVFPSASALLYNIKMHQENVFSKESRSPIVISNEKQSSPNIDRTNPVTSLAFFPCLTESEKPAMTPKSVGAAFEVKSTVTLESLRHKICLSCPNVNRAFSAGGIEPHPSRLRLWAMVRRGNGTLRPSYCIADGKLPRLFPYLGSSNEKTPSHEEVIAACAAMTSPGSFGGDFSPKDPEQELSSASTDEIVKVLERERLHLPPSAVSVEEAEKAVPRRVVDLKSDSHFPATPCAEASRPDPLLFGFDVSDNDLCVFADIIGLEDIQTTSLRLSPHVRQRLHPPPGPNDNLSNALLLFVKGIFDGRCHLLGTILLSSASTTRIEELPGLLVENFRELRQQLKLFQNQRRSQQGSNVFSDLESENSSFLGDSLVTPAEVVALFEASRPGRLDALYFPIQQENDHSHHKQNLVDAGLRNGDLILVTLCDNQKEIEKQNAETVPAIYRTVARTLYNAGALQFVRVLLLDEALLQARFKTNRGPDAYHGLALRGRPLSRAGGSTLRAVPMVVAIDLRRSSFQDLLSLIRSQIVTRLRQLSQSSSGRSSCSSSHRGGPLHSTDDPGPSEDQLEKIKSVLEVEKYAPNPGDDNEDQASVPRPGTKGNKVTNVRRPPIQTEKKTTDPFNRVAVRIWASGASPVVAEIDSDLMSTCDAAASAASSSSGALKGLFLGGGWWENIEDKKPEGDPLIVVDEDHEEGVATAGRPARLLIPTVPVTDANLKMKSKIARERLGNVLQEVSDLSALFLWDDPTLYDPRVDAPVDAATMHRATGGKSVLPRHHPLWNTPSNGPVDGSLCFSPSAMKTEELTGREVRHSLNSTPEGDFITPQRRPTNVVGNETFRDFVPLTGSHCGIAGHILPSPLALPLFVEALPIEVLRRPTPDIPIVVSWRGTNYRRELRQLHIPRFPASGSISLLIHLCATHLGLQWDYDAAVKGALRCPTADWVLSAVDPSGGAIIASVQSCCPGMHDHQLRTLSSPKFQKNSSFASVRSLVTGRYTNGCWCGPNITLGRFLSTAKSLLAICGTNTTNLHVMDDGFLGSSPHQPSFESVSNAKTNSLSLMSANELPLGGLQLRLERYITPVCSSTNSSQLPVTAVNHVLVSVSVVHRITGAFVGPPFLIPLPSTLSELRTFIGRSVINDGISGFGCAAHLQSDMFPQQHEGMSSPSVVPYQTVHGVLELEEEADFLTMMKALKGQSTTMLGNSERIAETCIKIDNLEAEWDSPTLLRFICYPVLLFPAKADPDTGGLL